MNVLRSQGAKAFSQRLRRALFAMHDKGAAQLIDARLHSLFLRLHQHPGRPQHVAGVARPDPHIGCNRYRLVVVVAGEGVQRVLSVFECVDGFYRWRIAIPAAAFVQESRVFLLDHGRIAQHRGAQIAGGVGAIHMAGEAAFGQIRNVAAVVDVRMRQRDGVDLAGVKREMLIDGLAVGPAALIETAVEQKPTFTGFQKVLRAGDSASSAPTCKLHGEPSIMAALWR